RSKVPFRRFSPERRRSQLSGRPPPTIQRIVLQCVRCGHVAAVLPHYYVRVKRLLAAHRVFRRSSPKEFIGKITWCCARATVRPRTQRKSCRYALTLCLTRSAAAVRVTHARSA